MAELKNKNFSNCLRIIEQLTTAALVLERCRGQLKSCNEDDYFFLRLP